MKGFLFLFALSAIALNVHAQWQNSFAQGLPDIRAMVMQFQKVQQCMSYLDPREVKLLEHKTAQARQDIYQLCASGQRQRAYQRGIGFVNEMENNLSVAKIKQCMNYDITGTPLGQMRDRLASKTMHVCDL